MPSAGPDHAHGGNPGQPAWSTRDMRRALADDRHSAAISISRDRRCMRLPCTGVAAASSAKSRAGRSLDQQCRYPRDRPARARPASRHQEQATRPTYSDNKSIPYRSDAPGMLLDQASVPCYHMNAEVPGRTGPPGAEPRRQRCAVSGSGMGALVPEQINLRNMIYYYNLPRTARC